MKYILLIYGDEGHWADLGEEESAAEMARWTAYQQEIGAEGILRGGDALHPTAAATTVRVRDGQALVTDGPFAETREQLGGYYVIECEGLDQAIDAARRIPSADVGSVEVRPMMEFEV